MKPKSSSLVVSSSLSNQVSKKNSLLSSHSNSNKMISGPGRPPQSRPPVLVSSTSLSAAKKPSTSAVSAQVRSLVSSGPKVSAAKQQFPSSRSILSKAPQTHSASSGNKSHVVPLRADQRRPGVIVPGRSGSGGHVDARRPLQSGASSKQVILVSLCLGISFMF